MSAERSWFKSSYSDPAGGECVEVAARPGAVAIRDSKLRDGGPQLSLAAPAWEAFIDRISIP
ncbi:DUF397 domain-containing protein [Streptomyces sp. NPDC001262]|uniref:DUF397 domain-containing protein n=1 Tax=unclassified Streptomyces TaxID=2593676 RepID=UPI0036C84E49